MVKIKMLFMKACTVIVIVYLSCPFFIEIRKGIELLYKRLIGFFLTLIQGNQIVVIVCSIPICLLAFFLILWIFRDDGEGKKTEREVEETEE